MKRNSKTALIIVLIILVIGGGLIGLGIAKEINAPKITNTHNIDEEFHNFVLDSSTADIEFKISEDSLNKVVCVENEKHNHTVKVEDDVLYINEIKDRKWYDFFDFVLNLKITIYLTNTDYGRLNIKSSTGSILIPDTFSFTSANLKLSTGNVNLGANFSQDLTIELSTGNVNLNAVEATNININGSTGNINLDNVSASEDIVVVNSTGNVNMTATTADNLDIKLSTGSTILTDTIIQNSITIKASTGNVRLDDSDADNLSIKTSTGYVKGTLLTSKVFDASSNTGEINVPKTTTGGLCEVTTTTGNIEIQIKE